jgi:1,4-dihydroxy-2-naphthoate polyprenyltransferase
VIKAWISAARLKTLPLSLAGIIMGSFAAKYDGFWDIRIFLLAILTTLCFQILSNFANDLGDTQKGTDNNERIGPTRAVQSGIISQKQMKNAVKILAIFGFISAILLIFVANLNEDKQMSGSLIVSYIVATVLSIAAAIMYTMGKKAYGYRGLGDVFVFLFFGIVGVVGSYGLFSKEIMLEMLLPASTIGFLSVAVLNLNNMRDIENDRSSHKNTIVVMLGARKAKFYHYYLLILAFITFMIYIGSPKFSYLFYLSFAPFFIIILHIKKVMNIFDPTSFEPELKKIALTTFFITIIFALLVNLLS